MGASLSGTDVPWDGLYAEDEEVEYGNSNAGHEDGDNGHP